MVEKVAIPTFSDPYVMSSGTAPNDRYVRGSYSEYSIRSANTSESLGGNLPQFPVERHSRLSFLVGKSDIPTVLEQHSCIYYTL